MALAHQILPQLILILFQCPRVKIRCSIHPNLTSNDLGSKSCSLPSNICQIQATLFGNTTPHPPIDSRTVRPKTRWRKGWRRPFWAVFAPFCTVFAPFRTIFAPFRIVLNRFRTVSSAERCEKFAKTCENFAKIPRKFANRLFCHFIFAHRCSVWPQQHWWTSESKKRPDLSSTLHIVIKNMVHNKRYGSIN